MKYILCVGDSLTFGARDEYHRSFPVHLSKLYHDNKKQDVFCVNHAISGETSGQLLRRVYFNSNSCTKAKVALLMIGTNDSFLPNTLEYYADNLRQICMMLKSNHQTLGMGILPPMIGPGLANYPYDGQQLVNGYNEVILETAKKFNALTCDFRDMHELIIDTVHFGNEGYCEMAKRWFNVLEKNNVEI